MIKQPEFARRRTQLMRMAGEDSVIILCASPEKIRNSDVQYPYRQNSDFLYLSGFHEPNAVLCLFPDEKTPASILFCRERDPEREMWHGPMTGLKGAVNQFGMDEAFDIDELGKRLPKLLQDRARIYYDLGRTPLFDQRLIGWLNELKDKPRKTFHAPEEIHALDHMLHDLRLYKSRDEIAAMRHSAAVAVEAHERAMRVCRPGMNEAEIHAELQYVFTKNQCEASYNAIVGGGANACVLHYIANKDTLNDGDLLLIDAGAEYAGYASDITRTFPVNGKFTPEQKDLYDVVLEAQIAAIDKARAGNHWQDVHDEAVRVATQGMIDLGILKLSLEEELEQAGYKHFYVHNTGHWLGLDVHDVGDYSVDGESRLLEPGMVMTVEPGIYIPPNDTSVRKVFRGIGIRIEDNVAVTKGEPLVLTAALAKSTAAIEALMAE
ncbi:MAG: aminopeptidase P N-terminal domain-containing protein [Xanthomonadales bacterium]|nr:aminopeptidase P N-terminal domain-containing protein [Xanthomonadales bacterium]